MIGHLHTKAKTVSTTQSVPMGWNAEHSELKAVSDLVADRIQPVVTMQQDPADTGAGRHTFE
jgi:hypothetical protein